MTENYLYYGDNLDILRRHIKDESADLVYLDPPFKSNQNYNVIFREQNGSRSTAQVKAFEDTWQWDQNTALEYLGVVETGGKASEIMQALKSILGTNDMLAYLTMMAPRLIELRRALKSTGSIYLHCDPTASHYLKLLMDSIFGLGHFRNEIIWKRTPFAGSSKARAKQFPCSHDVLLFYTKSDTWVWNTPSTPYSENYLERFKWDDNDGRGRYRKTLLKTYSDKTFKKLEAENRLIAPLKGEHWSYKQYLSESSGFCQIDDIWTDINALNPMARERLGYPTQKPTPLLGRIISASTNPGDTVLDPFCGCGTTIAAAQSLERNWIGIDVTHLAISLIKHRLQSAYGDKIKYNIVGEPVSLTEAATLAREDRYQFQWWALGLVGARPVEQKKGTDKGIDGKIFFHDNDGKTGQIILSVKSGHITVADVRDLRGVTEREKAEIGVFITLGKPTKPMYEEATEAGFYKSKEIAGSIKHHPRIQILTIGEILNGKQISCPPLGLFGTTFKSGQKAKVKRATTRNPLFPDLNQHLET